MKHRYRWLAFGRLTLFIIRQMKPGEILQWLSHDESTINVFIIIIIMTGIRLKLAPSSMFKRLKS